MILTATAVSTDCYHTVHMQCFKEMMDFGAICPICNSRVSSCIEDPELNAIIEKINRIKSKLCCPEQLFHEAIKNGEKEIVTILLDQGISPLLLFQGKTPLCTACENGQFEIVKLLIEKGADLNQFCSDRETPLFKSVFNGHEEIALYLIDKGARLEASVMHAALVKEELKVIKELHKRGIPFDEKEEKALAIAASGERLSVLAFLLEKSAKKDINALVNGKTPLFIAVDHAKVKNVKALLRSGADLSIHCRGMNILDYAQKKLEASTAYYSKHPEHRKLGDEIRTKRETIFKILNKAFVIRLIKDVLKEIGESKKMPFLYDLKDKATDDDDWMPTPTPFCDSLKIMKHYGFVDSKGHMPLDIKNIVKNCIRGEGLKMRIVS
jgi:hypothetical protein